MKNLSKECGYCGNRVKKIVYGVTRPVDAGVKPVRVPFCSVSCRSKWRALTPSEPLRNPRVARSLKVNQRDIAIAVAWLLRYQKREVRAQIRAYRKLTPGKQRDLGTAVAYLISSLEIELAAKKEKKK